MAMVDVAAVRRWDELDDLAGVQCAIDRFEGPGVGRAAPPRSHGRPRAGRSGRRGRAEIACHQRVVARHLGADAIGALDVDDAPVDEPGERIVEGRELVHRETILAVVGVQEVEGVLEIDVMGVTRCDRIPESCECS